MTVGEIERTMTSAECAEWYAFFKVRADDERDSRVRGGLKRAAMAGLDGLKRRR